MKKRYRINGAKAVRRFREKAEQGDREMQLHRPLKEIAAVLQEGPHEWAGAAARPYRFVLRNANWMPCNLSASLKVA